METICLSGTWRATRDLGLQARAGRPDYDDSAWQPVPVPGHWHDVPALAGATRLLYRRAFDLPPGHPAPGAAYRLRLDGVFYRAHVWINGKYLGEQEGYFAPHTYDVTRHLRPGRNAVMLEVACEPEQDLRHKRQVLGLFGHFDWCEPGFNPGGIWAGVWIDVYPAGLVPGALRVQALPEALPLPPGEVAGPGYVPPGDPIPATVRVALDWWSLAPGRLAWTVSLTPLTFAGEGAAASGRQEVGKGSGGLEVELRLTSARLWWTWDHGRPDLYRLEVRLEPDGGPPVTVARTVGIRKVELRDWHLWLNGRRIFLRGTNLLPPDLRLARCTAAAYERDLRLALAAHMNCVRLYAHVAPPACYDLCDRLGLLVWQDFPLQWQYHGAVAGAARRQAQAMVAALHHHPSIALWCCHNEPVPLRPTDPAAPMEAPTLAPPLPGRTVLAGAVAAAVRQADPTRPVVPYSGDFGLFGLAGGGDGHHYWGWYSGRVADFSALARRRPRTVRMVSEFGCPAFPAGEGLGRLVRGRWPDINWDELRQRYRLPAAILEKRFPARQYGSLDEYVAAVQQYQAEFLKRYIEVLRARKYRPCGGALQFFLADCSPGVTPSLLDFWRGAKPAYAAVAQAFSPAYILVPWPDPGYRAGDAVVLAVILVNDLYQELFGRWSWRVEREGQVLAQGGDGCRLAPDSVTTVPGVRWAIPADLAPGSAALVLELALDGQPPVENRYALQVVRPDA